MIQRRNGVDQVVQQGEQGLGKPGREKKLKFPFLIPSGSTLLNLACSDTADGAFVPGSLINIVGDSSAGKTFLLWTIFAEVLHRLAKHNYEPIYDEPERAFFFDTEKLFGEKIKQVTVFDPSSSIIQEWYVNVMKILAKKIPVVYGLDSFDSLSSKEEKDRGQKMLKKAIREKDGDPEIEEEKERGSYKTEKAKWMSEILRNITEGIESTKSLVAIISQTRQNIGVSFGDSKVRAGGDALRFYSSHEVWLSVRSHIKRKERDVGVEVLARLKKNKLTGKLRQVGFPIYFDYGIDDTGSCVDWLIAEGKWIKERGKSIVQTGDPRFPDSSRDKLISHIEDNGLLKDLQSVVQDVWRAIEQEIATGRKPKYEM